MGNILRKYNVGKGIQSALMMMAGYISGARYWKLAILSHVKLQNSCQKQQMVKLP